MKQNMELRRQTVKRAKVLKEEAGLSNVSNAVGGKFGMFLRLQA
jgi:hypothetical protein